VTSTSDGPVEAEVLLNDLQNSHEVLVGVLDLLTEGIDGPEWLNSVARYASCQSLGCLWWPAGNPEFFRGEYSGAAPRLTVQDMQLIDAVIQSSEPQTPGFVDDWAAGAARVSLISQDVLRDDRIIVCVDWLPARVIMIFEAHDDDAPWSREDRTHLARLLPIIHKSVAIKKRLSWNDDIAELVDKVFAEIPRGFIAMMPDRTVVMADQVARDLIKDGALLSLVDGKLALRDGQSHAELMATLESIETLPPAALGSFRWRKNLSGRAGPESYLAVTKGFEFDNWRRESTPSKRVAVMVLQNQQLVDSIDTAQVEEFFDLTPAQARVVVALAKGESAETAAATLNISVNTVRSHLRSIYAKLEVSNKSQMLHRVMSSLGGVTGGK